MYRRKRRMNPVVVGFAVAGGLFVVAIVALLSLFRPDNAQPRPKPPRSFAQRQANVAPTIDTGSLNPVPAAAPPVSKVSDREAAPVPAAETVTADASHVERAVEPREPTLEELRAELDGLIKTRCATPLYLVRQGIVKPVDNDDPVVARLVESGRQFEALCDQLTAGQITKREFLLRAIQVMREHPDAYETTRVFQEHPEPHETSRMVGKSEPPIPSGPPAVSHPTDQELVDRFLGLMRRSTAFRERLETEIAIGLPPAPEAVLKEQLRRTEQCNRQLEQLLADYRAKRLDGRQAILRSIEIMEDFPDGLGKQQQH